MQTIRVAAVQVTVSADISANGKAIREAIASAAKEGVRVVSFCEGSLSGYAKSQITHPDQWARFDWATQEAELREIAALCGQLHIFAVVGGAHRLSKGHPPHNSLYIFSDSGDLLTRYDKRFLSNAELGDWYTPGTEPITFEVDGYKFGCAICIEVQFSEAFSEYEHRGVDAVLFSSYGIPENFQVALRAHAALNCLWVVATTPAQRATEGPAGIIGPDGKWTVRCDATPDSQMAMAMLDRCAAVYDIPLNKARSWRARAREGQIYRDKMTADHRSNNRSRF